MADEPAAMYAIVTGASRGIGAAIARRLAAQGLDLVLTCRSDIGALESLADDLRSSGVQVRGAVFDVTDRSAAKAALEAELEAHGAPWAVVCNAGFTRDGLLMWMPEEDWDAVIGCALGGFYNVVKPVLPAMLRARGGRILTVASVSGQMGNAGQVNYSAAKGGLIAATKALAREVAKRGITANAVAPGLIETALTAELPLQQMLGAIPMQRAGTADEVAAAIAFLASTDAGYITGQVLGVNGGLYS
jgi:3-oxoacyl-[acyl-carrier protein] reductase